MHYTFLDCFRVGLIGRGAVNFPLKLFKKNYMNLHSLYYIFLFIEFLNYSFHIIV